MARIHEIRKFDIANTYWGPAVSIFFNFCPHRCPGCWNEETWKLEPSLEVPNDTIVAEVLEALDAEGIHKDLSLLGGEPLASKNRDHTLYILKKVLAARPETKVLCWTGYTWDQVKDLEIMQHIDVLIDGRYKKDLRVIGKKYGSSNQRIIDVPESLRTGTLVQLPD